MRYQVFEDLENPGEWVVQATGSDGEIYRVRFDYTDAEEKAIEYALWKNQGNTLAQVSRDCLN